MARDYRRVVTSKDSQGKSVIMSDSKVSVGPLGIVELWRSSSVPASLIEDGGKLAGSVRLEPNAGGVIFRLFEIPPQDSTLSKADAEAKASREFAAAGAEHCHVDTSRNPMMHTTRTIDYVVILSGQVTLLLDEGEVELRPFDAIVQRGTNHYWLNYGDQPALLMGVLLDAK